jgi:hypothetical protein
VTGGEHEAIAVQPARFGRVVLESMTKKHGPKIGTPQGQPQMTRGTGVHGIHRQAPGFGGGASKGVNRKIHKQMSNGAE